MFYDNICGVHAVCVLYDVFGGGGRERENDGYDLQDCHNTQTLSTLCNIITEDTLGREGG